MEAKLLTAGRFVDLQTGFLYRYILSDTEYFRPHYHDYYELFVVLSGNALHFINGTRLKLQVGDLVFIRCPDTHDYASADGQPFSMLNITFTAEVLEQLFAYLGDGFPSRTLLGAKLPPRVKLTAGELERLQLRMRALGAIPARELPHRKTAMRTLLFELFTRYFSEYTAETDHVPAWLEDLCLDLRRGGFVEGSERLFSMTDKSREYVCRSMKKYMGVTVTEYINDLRLSYICNMLHNSNHSITQIIYDSGFNNLSWAAQLFKEKYGTTMRQYRSRQNP